MSSPRIALARHGESTWNLAGRYQGRRESALSALGVRQALALGEHFFARIECGGAVPQRIVASQLLRCTATAEFVAERLGLAVETDPDLIEIAHGTWEGRTLDEIERDDPARRRAWREHPERVRFEGGEALADVAARWDAFVTRFRASEPRGLTLVITHDAVVRCALLGALGRPLAGFRQVPVPNGAYAELELAGAELRVLESCVDAHLEGLRADPNSQAL